MQEKLPIHSYAQQILNTVIDNQCVVLTGSTGCGKSTQIPIILHNFNKDLKILCTQPRRVACTNIAQRVSKLLNNKLGQLVGYHIGQDPVYNKQSKIIFVTTGILLQYLIHNPDSIKEYDCFILDEVHERDIDMDFIFLILKGLLKNQNEKKIILMSATIQAKKIAAYFENYQQLDFFHQKYSDIKTEKQYQKNIQLKHSPIINIQTQTHHKIETFYLDTLNDFFNFQSQVYSENKNNSLSFQNAVFVKEFIIIACDLIRHILYLENQNRLPKFGKFLIFLPGLAEIIYFSNQLKQELADQNLPFEILQIHSKLIDRSNIKLMSNDKTYFLIATNIAESSITIPNIRYIIDFCLMKQQQFNAKRNTYLGLNWSSQSSCIQRKGRTGRCNDGYSFLMVDQNFFQKLNNFVEPEILRTPLDKLILKINTIQENIGNLKSSEHKTKLQNIFGNLYNVFDMCIEKIQEGKILDSLNFLEKIKAIKNGDKKDCFINTFFGKIYSEIPCDVNLCKLILYGKIFGCQIENIILAGILSSQKSFFVSFKQIKHQKDIDDFLQVLIRFSEQKNCDFTLLLNVYKEWSKKFGVYQFYKNKKSLSHWSREIQKNAKNPENQKWLQKNFLILKGLIKCFEQIYQIFSNLNKLMKISENKEKISFEEKQASYLFSFFPNIFQLKKEDNILKSREENYLKEKLNMNPKFTIKVENSKYQETIRQYSQSTCEMKMEEFKNEYQKYQENYFKKLFGNDIKKIQNIDLDTYIEFNEETGIENLRRLFFTEKFQAKERYSIKLFSFTQGMEEQNFEDEQIYLQKKEKQTEKNNYEKKEKYLDFIKKLFSLKRIVYLNQYAQYDTINYIEIIISQYSINNKIIVLENALMITDQYQINNTHRQQARYTSLLKSNQNLIETLLLFFSDNHHYNKDGILDSINYEGLNYDLRIWYEKTDQNELKILKEKVLQIFLYKFSDVNNFYLDFMDFVFRKRKKFIFREKWFQIFKNKLKQNNPNIPLKDKVEQYMKFKNDTIQQQKQLLDMFFISKASLQCKECDQFIIELDEIEKASDNNQDLPFLPRKILRKSIWSLNEHSFDDKNGLYEEKYKQEYEIVMKKLEEFHKPFKSFYTCTQNHILLIQDIDRILYIPSFARIIINYPNGKKYDYEHFSFDYSYCIDQQYQALKYRNKALKDYSCQICQDKEYFDSYKEFYNHINTKDHREEEENFKMILNQLIYQNYNVKKFVIFYVNCFYKI